MGNIIANEQIEMLKDINEPVQMLNLLNKIFELETKVQLLEKTLTSKVNENTLNLETNPIKLSAFPSIEDLDYIYQTYKFTNIIPNGQTFSKLEIRLHGCKGLTVKFDEIGQANHKLYLKVYDPINPNANWNTRWLDCCDCGIPTTIFDIDKTRCVQGIKSTASKRCCYIKTNTPHNVIIYIRLGIPLEYQNTIGCSSITVNPVDLDEKDLKYFTAR